MVAITSSPNPSQETVLELCSQILHRPRDLLRIDQSFLFQGGDSLKAVQLITSARKAGLSITIQDLLQSGSLQRLCDRVLSRYAKATRLRNRPARRNGTNGKAVHPPAPVLLPPDLAKNLGPIPLSNVEDVFPCSKGQEAILTAQARDKSMYQCFVVVKLTSADQPIDVPKLETTWKKLIDTQVGLRVVLIESGSRVGGFDQVLLKQVPPSFKLVGNSDTAETTFIQSRQVTFEPYEAPYRLSIFRASDLQVFCKLEFSHALFDGTSVELLMKALLSGYHGACKIDSSLTLPDLHRFYSQPISDDYWPRYLKGAQITQLPVSRPEVEACDLSTISCDVGIDSKTVQDFCRNHAVTLSQICQLGWALVLRLFTASPDICFSYVASGRDIPVTGIESAAGCFVNLLPCRVRLDNSATVISLLNSVKGDFIRSIPYQHIAMDGRGQLATKPGNTVLSFMHRAPELSGSDDLTLEYVKRYTPTDFDVAVYIQVYEHRTSVEIDSWSSKVDPALAIRIGQTFSNAITSIIYRPHDKVKDLALLGELDRYRLNQWNARQLKPYHSLLHDLVYSQVLQDPDSIALQSWDGALTYRELDDKAQRLAAFLVSLGVKPETKVALSFEKSVWAVISQVAVLKAGGAVVSLDISSPLDRLRRIVEDSAATVLLIGTPAERLSGIVPQMITVDATLIDSLPDSDFSSPVRPNNSAWVIYTSGSTGTPKGVVLEHRTLCSTIMTHGPAYGLNKDSHVFQFSAYTFDVSIYDVFTTLCFGGCVCVPSEQDRLNNLAESMRSLQINIASLTCTVASLIHPDDVPSLKTLVLLGEPAKPEVVEEWAPHATVLNAYGPAEGCITTVGKLKSKQDASRIGQPLSCRVWITDPNDRDILNPIGVPGELLIEGPLVARGYLNNPSLTEKSFILDPSFIGQYGFSPGRRMYCTGDLVQQDTDGALRYLGRKDAQMKINGQRVDPGEIEYWAKAFSEDVKKSSVTLIHPRGDATRTILGLALEIPISRFDMAAKGILPLSEDLRVLLEGVRSLLLDKVPAYMVPSLYVPVGEIPQTSSSKVDRRALCTMLETLDSKQLSEYALANTLKEAASTPMEKRLQKLWAASLGASTAYFGVKDDFFVVGGDSLAAMKLVGHCRKDQIPLTVVDIFKHPRLDHMAELAEKKRSDVIQPSKDQTDEAFSLYPGIDNTRMAEIAAECDVTISQIEDVYPCSPLQEGLFTVTLRQPHAYMYRQVFRLNSIDVGQFQEAWQKVAQEVPIVRTVIVPDDTHQFLQVVLRRPLVWVTGICLDTYLEADKKIANQPGRALSRYAIISEGEQRYFVWTAHHSCYDGITLRKLFELVSQVYLGVQPKIPLPFKTFVNHLRAQEYGQATEFWRSQLQGGALSFPDLPHPKQEVRVTVRLFHRIPIPRGPLTVTLSNLLRAAWAIVISAATKRETVLFGATLSGRTAAVAGITDIAGPTITTVPIQIRINHHVAISNFLDEVQKQAIDMMPFEHTGLQYIRRLVSPTSNLPDLGNLFVVQFPQEQDELLAGFMPGLMPHAVASQEFDSYPLNVFCNLNTGESHNVNVEARFDSRAISTAAVKRLLEQFGLVIERLTTMPAKTRLGDIDVVSLKNISASGNGLDGSQGVPVNVEHQAVGPRYRSSGSQLEKDMQAICSDVLGLAIEDDTSLYRSFGNLGGDSFMAMQLVMRCRRKGITISVQDIIRSKSIGDLVSNIERLQHGSARKGARLVVEESVDWHAEAALGQVPESSRPTRGSQLEVILTGSTGFLGRHILEQLLASPNVSRVHCLAVRSQGLGSGRNEPPTSPKVITYSGDLTLPLLGLSGDQCELFASCSAIIHCGAQVSFVQPYQALQKANVESTKTLAHFAMKYGIPFHFISTLGVTHLSRQETFGEVSVSSYQPTNSANGYVASKWVSEVFLENANRETGLPVYIYRPSSIVGPGAPTLDIANNLVNFSRKMKVIPNFAAWNGHLDCVHINAVAANISGTVLQHQSQSGPGSVVYLHESGQLVLPYSGIKEYLESEGSTTLREVSLREWVSLALAQGLHTSVAEFLESSAENVTKEHMMPLCQTSRDYSAYGRVRL